MIWYIFSTSDWSGVKKLSYLQFSDQADKIKANAEIDLFSVFFFFFFVILKTFIVRLSVAIPTNLDTFKVMSLNVSYYFEYFATKNFISTERFHLT